MFSKDHSSSHHHTWSTLDHLSPALMLTRRNSQRILHLTEAKTVSSMLRSQRRNSVWVSGGYSSSLNVSNSVPTACSMGALPMCVYMCLSV